MRHPAKVLLTGAALLVATACNNDASVAPRLIAPSVENAALRSFSNPSSYDFVLPAAGGHVAIFGGQYSIDLPAGAVCDPSAQDSRDGYAAGAWDAPCTASTTDVPVHVTMKWSHHRLWADFSALRFVPGKTVSISTDVMAPIVRFYAGHDAAGNAFDNSAGRSSRWGILYAPSIDSHPVADNLSDPQVETSIDFNSGRISRRIKHFSGYNILTNEACVVSPEDPFCVDDGKNS